MLWQERAYAILRTSDQALAARAMDAAVRGGFRIIEFTLTVPGAFELIAQFAQREDVVVGAGTVLDATAARRAVEAGASFVVSPVVDPTVIAAAKELGVAAMPGVQTPTEALLAHRSGAVLQKLFPAPAGGPTWVRSCLAPLPFLRLVPTNGVDATNVAAWLAAGAWGVGFTTALFDAEYLARARFDAIEQRARALLDAARAHRRGEPPAPPKAAEC